MQSVWSRVRESAALQWRPPAGTVALAVFVVLLVTCLGNSTVAAQWVPGADGLTKIALVAALVMGVLALIRRLPAPAALVIGALLAPVAAYVAAHGAMMRAHPDDPTDLLQWITVWLGRLAQRAPA